MKKYFLQISWGLLAVSCLTASSLGAVKESVTPLTRQKKLWLDAHLGEYTSHSRVSSGKEPLVTMDKEVAPFWDVLRDFALQANSSIAVLSSFPLQGSLRPSVITGEM